MNAFYYHQNSLWSCACEYKVVVQDYVQRNIEWKLVFKFILKLNKYVQFPAVVLRHCYQPL